jgi:hypothetical protein
MIEFIMAGGPFMYPILIIALANLLMAVRSAIRIFSTDDLDIATETHRVNAILFWGCIALVTGFLAQFSGIYLAANIIAQVRDVSPAIVLMGFAQSFTTSITGMWVVIFSAILWHFLRGRLSRFVRTAK